MRTSFRRSFERDLKKIRDPVLLERIRRCIVSVESADDLSQVAAVRKMSGHHRHYRIRIGDYRLGLVTCCEAVEFVRVLHRRDIYKHFPHP